MQYKNIQIVEGISPNQNANSYGRNELIILYGNILIVVCKTLVIGNPNVRGNVKL